MYFVLKFGEKHEKTQESSDCLKHLTHQAVVLQKKMNEIYTGKTGATLPPIQIHPPSMGSVLDMLNVINGILYVQIRYVGRFNLIYIIFKTYISLINISYLVGLIN